MDSTYISNRQSNRQSSRLSARQPVLPSLTTKTPPPASAESSPAAHGSGSGGQNVRQNTAETLGKQHGVTERTIRRDGKMAQALEKLAEVQPEAAPRMLFGVNPFFTLALTQKNSRLEV